MKFSPAILLSVLLISITASAQQNLRNWHFKDPEKDGVLGISLTKAYELLKGRKPDTIIVAVIDSGIDTTQEDLVRSLWVNKKEIPGNGIDDDHNGYADDLHGWNFEGKPNGENMGQNSLEITRTYHRFKEKFKAKTSKDISPADQFHFSQWRRADSLLEREFNEYLDHFPALNETYNSLSAADSYIKRYTGKDTFSINSMPSTVKRDSLGWSTFVWRQMFSRVASGVTNEAIIKDIESYRNRLLYAKRKRTEVPHDIRKEFTGNDDKSMSDTIYGNNNLKSFSGNHGTLVAGIIGAQRNNGLGGDGIADAVKIMAVRAMPGGDEYDKDVALAIRYAVNNGAKIINISLGKPVSPEKKFVDDAVEYAAQHGVLIVHAAGNDGEDLSKSPFYPHPVLLNGRRANNFLEVGASGDKLLGNIAAPFSNYSKDVVDIFAPGMQIYNSAANNLYESADGTSVASPVAAGVAALLKSYFPKLSPAQIIDILMRSGTTVTNRVARPGDGVSVPFSDLSRSGRIVNAGRAVELALKLYPKP